jgi:hypothetical protein
MSKHEDIDRLCEIINEIKDLIHEARDIFADTNESGRFEGYPFAHIIGALDKDHGFLGGSFITMQDCIDGFETDGEDES